MKPSLLPSCIILTTLFCMPAAATDCVDTAAASEQYDVNVDGTVTDIESGLTWMRCSLGQSWRQGNCRGKAETMSWPRAHEQVEAINAGSGYAGHRDWRLPKLNELALLANRHCRIPRLDSHLFPATPAAAFWSRTPVPNTAREIYVLSFDRTGVSRQPVATTHFVRLVRGR